MAQDDDNPAAGTVATSAITVGTALLDDAVEERKDPGEEIVEDPVDASPQVVAVEETRPEVREDGDIDRFSVDSDKLTGLELTDARMTEVEAFAGLDTPVESRENPR